MVVLVIGTLFVTAFVLMLLVCLFMRSGDWVLAVLPKCCL